MRALSAPTTSPPGLSLPLRPPTLVFLLSLLPSPLLFCLWLLPLCLRQAHSRHQIVVSANIYYGGGLE